MNGPEYGSDWEEMLAHAWHKSSGYLSAPNGGASWTNLLKITPALFQNDPGTPSFAYRGGSLPSAGIDASGK